MQKKYLTKSIVFTLWKRQKNKSWIEEEFTPRANQCIYLGVQDVENSKPVFDPDFHSELIIKDELEDCNLGNIETFIFQSKKISINYIY